MHPAHRYYIMCAMSGKNRQSLLGFDTTGIRNLAVRLGGQAYRGSQIASWLYQKSVHDINLMSNLPPSFLKRLASKYEVGRSTLKKSARSRDGTFKLLLGQSDGELIETVGMPYRDRFTCCVSSQAGCAIGCLFCATGSGGFRRNLSAGEIVDQVFTVHEYALWEKFFRDGGDRVSNVVFMGMGEPLLNYDDVLKAVHLLNSEACIGMRNITVSTIGYVPGIYRLAAEKLQLTLAVSLHASNDSLRKRLVPGMAKYRLAEIVQACRDYIKSTGRRVTFEYCLLGGVNDGLDEAAGLAALLKGLLCHVNLIPYNSTPGSGFHKPAAARIAVFRKVLEDAGIAVTQREQRGAGIEAACGQLRRQSL